MTPADNAHEMVAALYNASEGEFACKDVHLGDVAKRVGSEACVNCGGRGGEFVRGLL